MSFEPYDTIYIRSEPNKTLQNGGEKKTFKIGGNKKKFKICDISRFPTQFSFEWGYDNWLHFFLSASSAYSFSLFSFSLAEFLFFCFFTGIRSVKRVERLTSCWSIQNRFLASMFLSSSKKGKWRNRVAAVDSFLSSAKSGASHWK